MKKVIAVTFAVVLLLYGCTQYSEAEWQKKYDLGEQYLLEENYEQAAIVFEELIEIDPMRPEGYTKTAEAYIALERFDDAQNIIQLGFEWTGDASLEPDQLYSKLFQDWKDGVWQDNYEQGMQYLDDNDYLSALKCFNMIIDLYPDKSEGYKIAADTYLKMDDYSSAEQILTKGFEKTQDYSIHPDILTEEWAYKWAYDDFIQPEEITLSGIPFYELTFEEMLSLYPGGELNTSDPTKQRIYSIDNLYFVQESSYEHIYSFKIRSAEESSSGRVVYQPEFRNLYVGEEIEDGLAKMGFTSNGIQYIMDSLESTGKSTGKGSLGLPANQRGGEQSASWTIMDENSDEDYKVNVICRVSADLVAYVSFYSINEKICEVSVDVARVEIVGK